jgi:intein-encoded DNA endonuclease-like protein
MESNPIHHLSLAKKVIKWYNSYMNKTNIIKFLKEIARLAIFSLPGAAILVLTQNPEIAGTYGTGILFVLRAIDKAIHDDEDIKLKGLLPF